MGKRLWLGLAAIVLVGLPTVKHKLNERDMGKVKCNSAYSKFRELCDTDGDGEPEKFEMDRRYTIITGRCKGRGDEISFEDLDMYLWSEGFGYNERTKSYISRD